MSKDVMSKIRAGDVWRELERVLREYRVDTFEVLDQRPHPVLVIRHLGLERSMSFSGSPSSRFTCKNEAAMLRRILKQMQMEAISQPSLELEPRSPIKAITFRGTEIDTVMHGGEPHVVLKRIVDGMGLDWSSQFQRAKDDSVLGTCVCLIPMQVGGQRREMVALPLRLLNGFLFGIDDKRVRPELQEGVIAYKRECYDALAGYWMHGVAVRAPSAPAADEPRPLLTREDMHTIGGIVKAVTGKQVADLRAEIVEMMVAAAQRTTAAAPAYDLSSTVTSREMMDMAGVDRAGRVRGTTGIITRRMKDFCLARGFAADRTPAHIDPDTRWRFPRTAAHEWLFGSTLGAEVIRSHIVKSHRGHGFTVVQPSLALGGAGARA